VHNLDQNLGRVVETSPLYVGCVLRMEEVDLLSSNLPRPFEERRIERNGGEFCIYIPEECVLMVVVYMVLSLNDQILKEGASAVGQGQVVCRAGTEGLAKKFEQCVTVWK